MHSNGLISKFHVLIEWGIFARIKIYLEGKAKSQVMSEIMNDKWSNEYDFNAVFEDKIIRAKVSVRAPV